MRIRTTIACLLIVVLATTIGGAIQQNQRLQSSREELTASRQQAERQTQELKLAKIRETEAAKNARTAEEECDALQKRITAMTNQVPSTSEKTASQPPTMQEYGERQLNLAATDPEYQKLSLELNRLGYGASYARFYKDHGLTPEQIARFEELLVARMQASYDLIAAAQTQGIKRNDPAFRKLDNPAQAELAAKFKELLGEEGYADFRKYSTAALWNNVTRDLTTALFYSAEPLALSQADKFTEVVKRNTSRTQATSRVDWNTVYAQVGNVLTPLQLATLKSQRETERLGDEMRGLVDKAAAAKR